MKFSKRLAGLAATTVLATGLAGAASATMLSITVTNNQSAGGLSVTPLYTGFHDGSFDAFDVGSAASNGVKTIAETGNAMPVAGERLAADPNSVGQVFAASGPPPIQPGQSVTEVVDINATGSVYLSFLSMVLPSNDTFIGNDDPTAYQLFDMGGSFLGDQIIEVTGAHIYDAGTEVNGLTGSAFVAGQDIALGADENGVITAGQSLADFAGQTLATGAVLGDAAQLDFFTDPRNFSLLTIEISRVAPVPLPASGMLLLGALGLMRLRARKS
jgi:hypothetical protein